MRKHGRAAECRRAAAIIAVAELMRDLGYRLSTAERECPFEPCHGCSGCHAREQLRRREPFSPTPDVTLPRR